MRRQRGNTWIKRAVSEKRGQRGYEVYRRDDRKHREERPRCQRGRTRIKRAALENEVSAGIRPTDAMTKVTKKTGRDVSAEEHE